MYPRIWDLREQGTRLERHVTVLCSEGGAFAFLRSVLKLFQLTKSEKTVLCHFRYPLVFSPSPFLYTAKLFSFMRRFLMNGPPQTSLRCFSCPLPFDFPTPPHLWIPLHSVTFCIIFYSSESILELTCQITLLFLLSLAHNPLLTKCLTISLPAKKKNGFDFLETGRHY